MRRHRFEPARLLLGLLLVGAALVYVMDALDEWRVPTWLLLMLVPASLLAAAFTAVTTFAVRRFLRRRRARAPQALGAMPMDELRGGYGRPEKRDRAPADADADRGTDSEAGTDAADSDADGPGAGDRADGGTETG